MNQETYLRHSTRVSALSYQKTIHTSLPSKATPVHGTTHRYLLVAQKL